MTMPSSGEAARARRTTAAIRVSLSTTSAKTDALERGFYDVWADEEWFFEQGAQGTVEAVVGTSTPLGADDVVEGVYVSGTDDDGFAGILASGTGTMYAWPRK